MAFTITLSTAATRTAYQRFGDAYIAALSQAMPGLDMEQCQSILAEVVGTVGRKAPKEKKAPKAKAVKTPSPSKRDLKKVELIGELKSYGAFAGDIPAVDDVSITDIRKQIALAKKAKKASEKTKTPKKAAKKAKKSPKKAQPSKRDLKKAELAKEIEVNGGSLEKAATDYSIPDLRKMLKSLAQPKKSKKASAAGSPAMSKRDQKKVELLKEIKALGGDLPDSDKPVSDYSISELRAIIKALTPKKKKGRKPKKAAAEETDHEALLATLASSLQSAEAEAKVEPVSVSAASAASAPTVSYELAGECTVASITTFTGGANDEVVATTVTPTETVSAIHTDEEPSTSDEEELEEEEDMYLSSESDLSSDDDSSEEED